MEIKRRQKIIWLNIYESLERMIEELKDSFYKPKRVKERMVFLRTMGRGYLMVPISCLNKMWQIVLIYISSAKNKAWFDFLANTNNELLFTRLPNYLALHVGRNSFMPFPKVLAWNECKLCLLIWFSMLLTIMPYEPLSGSMHL